MSKLLRFAAGVLCIVPLPQDAFADADWGALKIRPYAVAELVDQIRIDRECWQDEWRDFTAEQTAALARALELVAVMDDAELDDVQAAVEREPARIAARSQAAG
jgi:hypothetical protein